LHGSYPPFSLKRQHTSIPLPAVKNAPSVTHMSVPGKQRPEGGFLKTFSKFYRLFRFLSTVLDEFSCVFRAKTLPFFDTPAVLLNQTFKKYQNI
jgi:hypothetical protein